MKISTEYPPNYKDIEKVLPTKEAVFCFGDTIYNPYQLEIMPDVIVHEATHTIQQGKDPKKWWKMYLKSPDFRLNQEIQAYAAQYSFVKKHIKDREFVYLHLLNLAKQLSGPEYGSLIKPVEAKNLIKEYAEKL